MLSIWNNHMCSIHLCIWTLHKWFYLWHCPVCMEILIIHMVWIIDVYTHVKYSHSYHRSVIVWSCLYIYFTYIAIYVPDIYVTYMYIYVTDIYVTYMSVTHIIKVCRQRRKTFLLLYCLFFVIFFLFFFFSTKCVLRFLCHFSSDLSHIWPVGR